MPTRNTPFSPVDPLADNWCTAASKFCKGWESGFQIGAGFLGILINGSNGSNAGVWITALLAASGAFSTHIHANQIDNQAGDLYGLVVIPLKRWMRMREKLLIKNGAELSDDWDASFVEDCEHILLSQTLQWSSIVSLKVKTMKEALRNHVLMVGRIGIADKIENTDSVNQDSKVLWHGSFKNNKWMCALTL